MHSISYGKLGRRPKRDDPRTLKLAAYVKTEALPTPPPVVDLTLGIPTWPMYANDSHGDCTCAAAAHMVEIWSLQAQGVVRTFTDAEVLRLYDLVNGGVDDGAVELDVLNTWRRTGLGGDKIVAYTQVGHHDEAMLRVALWLFSGLYLGVELPKAWQGAAVWDAVEGAAGAPGSWGGHAINAVGYNADGIEIVSWGQLILMTWAAVRKYLVESYCVLPGEYRLLTKPLEHGFAFDHLMEDLAAVAQ